MMVPSEGARILAPFNGPIEIGLRALSVLAEFYPEAASLQRLVIFDYLVVHSDDLPGGPSGLHPKTPHRGGELLVRRGMLQEGLLLFESRGLVVRRFVESGVLYSATEDSGPFLDSLRTAYTQLLRERARWVADEMRSRSEDDLDSFVSQHVGEWGAEFELESVLWAEEEA